jgi:hypothetical protein
VICQDPIFGAEVQAPCGHFYGIDCITDLFQSATRDESLYPPRCCRQNITLPQVRPHLTQALLAEFELKAQEFGTLKRVYCATPTCSRFLGPLHEGFFSKVFTCTSHTCTTTTCGACRGRYEGWNHSCTPDAETERLLTLSRTSGWSRCPGCAQMIELNMGCFHMTCRCRTEFCYLCRARWKSCRCPQWDETRLLAAAEQRVDAQLQPAHRAQPVNPPRQAPAVPRPALAAARGRPIVAPRQAPVVPQPAPAAARVRPIVPPRQALAVPQPAPAATRVRPIVPPRQAPAVPRPAPAAASGRLIGPPRQAPAVPRPAPVIPPRQAPAVAPRPAPFVDAPVNHPEQVPATAQRGRPGAVINVPPTTHRAEAFERALAPTPAPAPAPAQALAWTMLAAENARNQNTTVLEPQPAPAVNTAVNRNAIRERMIRETMEHLRVDHVCQHTTWRYCRGNGRCESCDENLPNYLFVRLFCRLVYIDTRSDLTICSGVEGVKCSVVIRVDETVHESANCLIKYCSELSIA